MTEPRLNRQVEELVFDPEPLSAVQRDGLACVSCGKRWPRPGVRVGRVPSGAAVYACAECAPAIEAAVRALKNADPPSDQAG